MAEEPRPNRSTQKPPKPKPKKRKPGQVFPGVGTVVTPGPKPKVEGQGPFVRQTPEQIARRRTRVRRILKRQRLLRSAGFDVVVDGVWGPRSQRAWNQYRIKPRAPFKPAGMIQREEGSIIRRERKRVEQIREQAAAAKVAIAKKQYAADQRERQMEQDRQAVITIKQERAKLRHQAIARGQQLLQRPEVARRMTLRQVTSALTDPTFKFKPTNQTHVRILQEWLHSHGHTKVQVSGQYDRTTHDELESALKREERQERERQVRELTEQLYTPGILTAGQKPDWWMLSDPIPKPGQLLSMLQGGGFTAAMLWKQFARQAQLTTLDFQRFRQAELLKIAQKFNSLGATRLGTIFGPGAVQDSSLYAEILLHNPLAFPVDNETPDMKKKRERQLVSLTAQVDALFKARSVEDFQRKFQAYAAVEEQKLLNLQKEMAGKDVAWYGVALEKALAPGEFLRTALVTDVHVAIDFLHGDFRYATEDRGDKALRWQAALEAQENPKWWGTGFAFEVMVDPLNFAHPFKTASTVMKSLGASRFGGYSAGRVMRGSFRLDNSARAFIYEKGTWGKALRQTVVRDLEKDVVGRGLVEFGRKATALKGDMTANVTARLDAAARRGFRASKDPALKDPKIKAKTRDQVESEFESYKGALLEYGGVNPQIHTFRQTRASMFVDEDGLVESNIAASWVASFAEKYKALTVQRLIANSARKIMDEAPAGEELGLTQVRALQEARRIREGVASFTHGSGDRELTRYVDHLTKEATREFRQTVLPGVQRVLVDFADQGGYSLWDDAGKWAGRHGDPSEALKAVQREAFDPGRTVKRDNPLFGQRFSNAERHVHMEDEIGRRTWRVRQYVARGEAAETLSETFDPYAQIAKIEEEVEGAWVRNADGSYSDSREVIEVPDLYAQHLVELTNEVDAILTDNPDFAIKRLIQLGEAPKFSAMDDFDQAIGQMAWDLGGMSRRVPKQLERVLPPPRRFPHPEGSPGANQADRFRDATRGLSDTLAKAWDEALPNELRREFALWQAMSEAQSWWMKSSYYALKAGLGLWIFATLALRPAWVVKNTVDNAFKTLIAGVRDPRAYFHGAAHPGELIRSVFDLGILPLRGFIMWADGLFGSRVGEAFDRALNQFWYHPPEVIRKVLGAHGVDVPESAIEDMRFTQQLSDDAIERTYAGADEADVGIVRAGGRWTAEQLRQKHEAIYDLMGNRPENYFKRVIYRDTYRKAEKSALAAGASPGKAAREAHDASIEKIEATLFDYSKITVAEDNLRFFFPFIQFWRKNSTFWIKNAINKPYLPLGVEKFMNERDEAHEDWPEWMRRYIKADEVTDALAVVPGLEWMVGAVGLEDAAYDPMNYLSFAPLYRSFKSDNQNLPADQQGMKFFGGMFDALNDWGLGLNPFVRKPLEAAGIANQRSWQTVFPQTSVAVALTRKYWGEEHAGRVADWERIFTLMLGEKPSDQIAEDFDYYVNMEIAGQLARGEQADRAKAEGVIKDWFLLQNLHGYFHGAYLRRINPQDFYLAKLLEDTTAGRLRYPGDDGPRMRDGTPIRTLTPREQRLLQVWRMRGANELAFDRYVQMLPLIESYYRLEWDQAQQLLEEHPELIPHVDSAWRGKPLGKNYVKNAQLHVNSAEFYRLAELADTLDLPHEVSEAAERMLKTPELEAFWSRNDTKADIRRKHIQGELHKTMHDLGQTYHSIPEGDFASRESFLQANPDLIRYWGRNNDAADDYSALLNGANKDLRESYFAIQEERGWDEANKFLKKYPWMFEGTRAEGKINEDTGQWRARTQHAKDYLAAKPQLSRFFSMLDRVGADQAFKWLYDSDTEDAKIVRDYFAKYGKNKDGAAHARDYLQAKKWLALYFDMDKEARTAWLNGDSDGAKIVRNYFEKYANDKGMTQHAKDFLEVRDLLNRYFSMPKSERSVWLNGGSADANRVLEYFKKYGKLHQRERAFLRANPEMAGGTPEQRRRMEFWHIYFSLTPDQRPSFVAKNAEKYGVFVYGALGEQERHDRQAAWTRRAIGAGLNRRQAAYLYVKPLLDFYFQLPKNERQLFLRANPEVKDYLDRFADGSPTGNAKLDKLVESYFDLAEDSDARSAFLRKHPEVQDYFDKRSTPAERVMRAVLESYFGIRDPNERRSFLEQHPEIQVYFDQRREERRNEREQLEAFDYADPRMKPFFEETTDDLTAGADRMRRSLRYAALRSSTPDTVEYRRDTRRTTGSL